MFGSARTLLKDRKNLEFQRQVEKVFIFREQRIEEISEIIADRLGGRGTYRGIHLRMKEEPFVSFGFPSKRKFSS